MATRSQVPYFFKRPVLSPPVDFGPPSESDFLLLTEERADDLRESFGAEPRRSLRLNLWPPPSEEWTDEGFVRSAGLASTGALVGAGAGDDASEDRSGLVPDMLAALLCGWLGGRLGGRVGGALHGLLSDGEGELVGDGDVEVVVEWGPRTCKDGCGTTRGSKPLWLLPASRRWELWSGEEAEIGDSR